MININILNTEKDIPLCRSASFRLPTIGKAIEDWQLQSRFTGAYAIFTWNFQIFPSVGMWLRIWWKFPETTLESDSFLSSLRSGVLGGTVKVGGRGKGLKKRLSVNRERSWLRHVDEQSIMPINLFNLFDLFWFDPWSLVRWSLIDSVIQWSLIQWSLIQWSFILFFQEPFSSASAFFLMIKFQSSLIYQFITFGFHRWFYICL